MTDNPWFTLAWRAAACAAVSGVLWYYLGLAVAVPTAVLWGVALAKPILEVTADLVGHLRSASLRDVEGVHYAHAGKSVEVIEDDDARWLRAAHIQRLLGDPATEAVFAHRFGADGSRREGRDRWYVRDEALIDYLEQSDTVNARRNALRLFVLRDVMNPHRHRRRRAGRD